ncbi:hypothetical protein DSLASN_47930 [Desulfoluna limicola]|uniref:Uncharacterized protein n=1 Tax=Desulfoluna limicola TaxID=2810562 RepID=A0ABM7PPQ2_9BACT|nr:hypothetical protein [Desulfoluna limicola]BCS99161.1 hypothetical protein DSLASN_47930 [Desulfoluna limicola]
MNVSRSTLSSGIIGITGHVGAGHVHSNFGFVQDDSAGFAVTASLLRQAFPVCTTISSVDADIETGIVTVKTEGGGTGSAQARRGITPYEATLGRLAIGMDAIYSQHVAFAAFGRIYGQGVLELPVALQTAACLAVVDTFEKKYPGEFVTGVEGMPGKVGKVIGAVLDIDSVPVSVMAIINASEGGLGPDEDLEGNILLGDKGRAMKELGLGAIPTIILESKAYVPAACKGQEVDKFWVRMNKDVDNRTVYNALVDGVRAAGLPSTHSDAAYPRGAGDMATATRELGERIVELGTALSQATTAREKVRIVGELAILVSQDAGGVTFMSSDLHNVVGGGGIMPGMSAVLSMTVSEQSIRTWKIPVFTAQDSENYLAILQKTLPILASGIEQARKEMDERCAFQEDSFTFLFSQE